MLYLGLSGGDGDTAFMGRPFPSLSVVRAQTRASVVLSGYRGSIFIRRD